MKCKVCGKQAQVGLKSHNAAFCGECYLQFFRRQVERGIESQKILKKGDKVLAALSGGKDSMSLMLELSELGYDTAALFVDLGIPQSSAEARGVVSRFCEKYGFKLFIVDLASEGLAIPLVKSALRRPVCSACGQIKRAFFNKIAIENGFDALATGHNLDDETSRLFSNTLRWDADRLGSQGPLLPEGSGFARKIKPLWRLTEFETANYAFLRGLESCWAPCPYSGGASFSALKSILGRLEQAMPGRKLDFYQGFLRKGRAAFSGAGFFSGLTPAACPECGQPTCSPEPCGVCRIKKLVSESRRPDN